MAVPQVPDWFGNPEANQLYFGRMALDGVPTQGPVPPVLTNEEFDRKAVPLARVHYGVFDTSDRAQTQPADDPAGKTLEQVLTGIANGSFTRIQYAERWIRPAAKGKLPRRIVWIVWSEHYMHVPTERNLNNGGSAGTFV